MRSECGLQFQFELLAGAASADNVVFYRRIGLDASNFRLLVVASFLNALVDKAIFKIRYRLGIICFNGICALKLSGMFLSKK